MVEDLPTRVSIWKKTKKCMILRAMLLLIKHLKRQLRRITSTRRKNPTLTLLDFNLRDLTVK